MPSLYSTYVYKQYIACSRQAFTWNSWFERKLLSYCAWWGSNLGSTLWWGSNLGSTPPRSSHPPCGAFSSNVSSSQVNKVITLCKASGHYTCLKCFYYTLVDAMWCLKTDIPIDIGFRWIFYSSNVFYWQCRVSVNPLYIDISA